MMMMITSEFWQESFSTFLHAVLKPLISGLLIYSQKVASSQEKTLRYLFENIMLILFL